MGFYADFHIHSRHSRSTSPALELPELARWAGIKGLTVVGSGDFTHPLWFHSLKSSLYESAPGLFCLKKDQSGAYFILSSEISLIYKKNNRVRKVHLLVLAPSLATVEKINSSLGRRFNLRSDGRPILGAAVRDLSAEILDIDDRAMIIPAHIWTPWFSLLGSKSGFDSLEECFEDVAPYIYAVETGLSADPPMLAQVSSLRRYTILSNSDAHSAQNLGREANEFDCPLNYDGIAHAIRSGNIVRTIEFFPEEGKYHHDGHRLCGISLPPSQTRKLGGICPVCNKPLTLGVLYRAEELADRVAENRVPFNYQIPLKQILSQIFDSGENSKKVCQYYFSLIDRLGPEFHILQRLPIKEISGINERLAAAIQAMRENRVRRIPGYDGVYGKIVLDFS
ncbi:MAG TPA: endonuclease Q family protein [Patescibacteria group bacterium]|nr:endonuclease Q family protein [Patescibacteria group bacterium]